MKNGQILKAYKALEKLADQPMPIKTAYSIFKLRQKLKPVFLFCSEREQALFDELKPEVKEDGLIYFKNVQDREHWEKQQAELNEIDSEIEVTPLPIKTDDLKLSLNDVESLIGFVEFDEN